MILLALPHLLSLLGLGGDATPPADAAAPASQPEPAAPLIAQDEEEEPMNEWNGMLSLGASLSDGNTNNKNATVLADARYRREKDRTTLGFWWYYSEQENAAGATELTDRRTGGQGQYDYFLSEKTYLLGTALVENDLQADIELRATAGVGVGRQFREDEKLKFNGEVGISYFNQDFYTAPSQEYAALRLAYGLDWKISESWALLQAAQAFPSIEDQDNVYTRLDTRVLWSMTEKMFSQLQWLFDWNNQPAPGAERSDHRLVLTIGWGF